MKMRFTGFLAFAVLSISILSYGVNVSSFADSHNILPLTVTADLETYANGSNVSISGSIKDYDSSSGHGLTFLVKSPANSIVTIGQLVPSSNGSFQYDFVAGGPLWKLSGDYIIEFNYGSTSGETNINYVGGELDVSSTEPEPTEPEPTCGAGTELVNGICQVIKTDEPEPNGGGCLIATAAYGTELAPQVQFLREIRDNTVMSTSSGSAFMTGFNQFYYSFSPTIADMERENPMFQEIVRAFITPMVSTLSIMTLAEDGSEVEVLGLGISVIALNFGMYIAAPALIGIKVHNHFKSRK